MLLSGWRDGQMRAHDAEDGKLLWCIDNCHRGGVTALTVHAAPPRHRPAPAPPPPLPPLPPASASASLLLCLLLCLLPPRSHATARRAPLQVSHNRKFVVSGGEEGEVRVWEIRTREMILHLKQHTMAITSLCVFEDDSQVISADP